MKWGLAGAILWALDTVIIGLALAMLNAAYPTGSIVLAPLVSTFLHDAIISLLESLPSAFNGRYKAIAKMMRGKAGWYVVAGSLIGCPVANAGNMLAISQIGPSYAAAITAFYPAVGALLARIFLGERMRWIQWVGLGACMAGVAVLGFNPQDGVSGNWAYGIIAALVAVVGWAVQVVFISLAFRMGGVDGKMCVQVRYTLSVIVYLCAVFPALGAWGYVGFAVTSAAMPLIGLSALAGMAAMLCYYIGLAQMGATRAMAIDITYAAWAIPLEFIILGRVPSALGVVCSITVVAGSIVAASDMSQLIGRPRGEGST